MSAFGYDPNPGMPSDGAGDPNAPTDKPSTGNTTPPPAPSRDDQNAYDILVSYFRDYGIDTTGDFAATVWKLITDYGASGDAQALIKLKLRDTDAYKKRFKGNELRKRLHPELGTLSEAEYVTQENTYRSAMRAAGLPTGFYDSNDDFANWIGNDVSGAEVNDRIVAAAEASQNFNPDQVAALQQMYGITKADLIAYALDPDRATSLIKKQYGSAAIAGVGKGQGVNVDRQTAEMLQMAGYSADQANQGFGQVKDELNSLQRLAAITGDTFSQDEAVADVFNTAGADKAKKKKESLASQERARFSGSSGLGRSSLAKQQLAL